MPQWLSCLIKEVCRIESTMKLEVCCNLPKFTMGCLEPRRHVGNTHKYVVVEVGWVRGSCERKITLRFSENYAKLIPYEKLAKMVEMEFSWGSSPRRPRASVTLRIDKLDGAHIKVDDQIMPVWQRSCVCAMGWCGFCRFLGLVSSCRMSRNCLHEEGVPAPLHRHACAGVSACLQWAWCHGALNRCSGHQCMQVCTCHRCHGFWHHHTYLWCNHCRERTCACVCAVCSFTLGDEGEEVELVNAQHLSLGVGALFEQKDR